MVDLKNFQADSANWREVLRRNQRKTLFVMLAFISIYLALGFLIDLYLRSGAYPNIPLAKIAMALLTLKLIPFATLIAGGVAVISILIAFGFHNKLMLMGTEYFEITPENARSQDERQLYNVVEEMKVAAGLHYMPRVFVIDAEYMNAFASGYSEKSAMVAITRGLMEKLDRAELQAVMAHEVSHVRHMDIKLTLMASVLSNLILIMIDVMFWGVIFGRSDRRDEGGGGNNWLFFVVLILRYVLPILTVILMLFLSRTREYMADAGCVELMRDNEPLARALLKIQGDHEENKEEYAAAYQSTPHEQIRREAYIFDPYVAGIEAPSSVSDFFSTHPGIESRLAALGFRRK